MLISQLKCDLLCRLSACFDLRALCRRRFCEGDVALVLSKKEKAISAHKQEKLITLKGKDAEKAAPGTDWKVEGSSLNIRRFRCSAEKREKAEFVMAAAEGRRVAAPDWRGEDGITVKHEGGVKTRNSKEPQSLKWNHCISCVPKEERGSRSLNINAFTFITGRVSRHTLG